MEKEILLFARRVVDLFLTNFKVSRTYLTHGIAYEPSIYVSVMTMNLYIQEIGCMFFIYLHKLKAQRKSKFYVRFLS